MDEPAAIEAEVIESANAPAPAAPSPAPGGLVTTATTAAMAARRASSGVAFAPRHCLTYPASGRAIDVFVTDREFKIVTRYLETLNARAVAAEFSVGVRTIKNTLQSERLNGYVSWRLRQIGEAAGLTMEKVLAKLNVAIDGTEVLSEDQLSAIGHAARILKPAVTSLTLNQQNNFAERGAAPAAVSPYAKMGREELLLEMRGLVAETDDGKDAA